MYAWQNLSVLYGQMLLCLFAFDLLESSLASGPDTFTIQVLFERFSKWVLPCFQHLPIQIQLGKHSAGVGFRMVPGYWLSSFIIFNPSQHISTFPTVFPLQLCFGQNVQQPSFITQKVLVTGRSTRYEENGSEKTWQWQAMDWYID